MTTADQEAVRLLRDAFPDLVAAYHFGSTSTGTAGPQSDIDLAILTRSRLDPNDRFALQERVASALRQTVDLVDLRAASTVMAMQVVGSGELLYESDAGERGFFEDLTFSQYARLNEERRGVLDRIAREGTVYGR